MKYSAHIQLNADGVSSPARIAALEASEIVRFCLNSLAKSNLSVAPEYPDEQLISYEIHGQERTAEERQNLYKNWILGKAFQDLARGVRASLEEAYFFIEMIATPNGMTTLAKINERIFAVRKAASDRTFPDLMKRVNANLKEPMSFDKEFLTLQKVRNCLEHRGGIVQRKDLDDNETLQLDFPKIKCFYLKDSEEIELERGVLVDPGEGKTHAEILTKRVIESKIYALGERITFTAFEFHTVAFACNMFAHDLATKLRPRDEKLNILPT